tara:strand:- start:312 stop:815 length:504 start_codon:yes stop_codon:yes gene_type:complete
MIKISIVGPESSGKSTLALSLSQKLDCKLCEEYSRKYLEKKTDYDVTDLKTIAKKQDQLIRKEIVRGGKYLIVDTCVLDIELWSKIKYNKVDEKILDLSRKEEFDFYLLCKPDIPWEYDKLRENQYNRESIYEEFKSVMKEKKLNYFIIEGSVSKRISSALKIINNY